MSCKWSFEGEIQLPSWRQTLFKIEKKREKKREKKKRITIKMERLFLFMEKRAIWHGWAPVSDNSHNYQGLHSELPPGDTTPATPKDTTRATTEGHNSS